MTGFGLTSLNSTTRGLLQVAAKIASDNYPENMGATFVVNAPFSFTGAWSVVKHFLDERTRAKITILGTSFLKELLVHVDISSIPKFLGGECTCEGQGGCFKSNAGPWQMYEQFKPFGIIPKGEAPLPLYYDMSEKQASIIMNEKL